MTRLGQVSPNEMKKRELCLHDKDSLVLTSRLEEASPNDKASFVHTRLEEFIPYYKARRIES